MPITASFSGLPYDCSLTVVVRRLESGNHLVDIEAQKGDKRSFLVKDCLLTESGIEFKACLSDDGKFFSFIFCNYRNITDGIVEFELEDGIVRLRNPFGKFDCRSNLKIFF